METRGIAVLLLVCARVPGAVALVLLDRFSTAYRGTQMVAAIVLMVSEQELRGEHGRASECLRCGRRRIVTLIVDGTSYELQITICSLRHERRVYGESMVCAVGSGNGGVRHVVPSRMRSDADQHSCPSDGCQPGG